MGGCPPSLCHRFQRYTLSWGKVEFVRWLPPVLGCFSLRGCTLWDPESHTRYTRLRSMERYLVAIETTRLLLTERHTHTFKRSMAMTYFTRTSVCFHRQLHSRTHWMTAASKLVTSRIPSARLPQLRPCLHCQVDSGCGESLVDHEAARGVPHSSSRRRVRSMLRFTNAQRFTLTDAYHKANAMWVVRRLGTDHTVALEAATAKVATALGRKAGAEMKGERRLTRRP